jgi:hypothetical protein
MCSSCWRCGPWTSGGSVRFWLWVSADGRRPVYPARPCPCGLDGILARPHSHTGALHLLHFWALRHGSKADFEHVLERMNEHCLQLGLHQKATVALYPAEESGGRLFYLTMYKDTWVSSLCNVTPGPPLLTPPGGTPP